jgi:hypothetical protein
MYSTIVSQVAVRLSALRACRALAPRNIRSSVVGNELCYKPESRGFEAQWGQWIFSVYLILPTGDYSASNRNEYQKQKNVSSE